MPFGTITVGSNTFDPRSPGIYSNSAVAFGDPQDEFRIRGASGASKTGIYSCSITRYRQVDVEVNGDSIRKNVTVSLTINVPSGQSISATDIDALCGDISSFITAGTVTRLLQGES